MSDGPDFSGIHHELRDGERLYVIFFASPKSEKPYGFPVAADTEISAVLTAAHVVQLLYPLITKYEVWQAEPKRRIVKVQVGLAVAALVKPIQEWLGVPMPFQAARVVVPKGKDFDVASYFKKLSEERGAGAGPE